MKSLSFLLLLLLTGACSNKNVPVGGACATTSQCATGLFCTSGKCAAASCTSNNDCKNNETCSNSVCICATAGGCNTTTSPGAAVVTGVTVNKTGTFTLTGSNLQSITGLQVSGGSITATPLGGFAGSNTTLTAQASASIAFAVGTAYSLVVTSAGASETISITFTPDQSYIVSPDTSSCDNGAVLTWNGSAWSCGAAPSSGGTVWMAPSVFQPDGGSYSSWKLTWPGWVTSVAGSAVDATILVPNNATLTNINCFNALGTPASDTWGVTIIQVPSPNSHCAHNLTITTSQLSLPLAPSQCTVPVNNDVSSAGFNYYVVQMIAGDTDETFEGCNVTYTL